ncbi:MAG: hypothetical protein NZ480_03375 [Bdellovibrionaceae bacterium]|nr:hypothetical protein [Pseudobdellovibrionaceae bacterium]MDW8190153.1 hypothetical protein [Pseudobdellovibrionaceae bacterium]
MIQTWDVVIQSKGPVGIYLALRLKASGCKVAWMTQGLGHESESFFPGAEIPYFMGVWPHCLDTIGFQLVQELFNAYRNPFGFSVMTPWGPIDYQHTHLIDWLQHRAGYSQKRREEWLLRPVIYQYLNAWEGQTYFENGKLEDLAQDFLVLYPKQVKLFDLLKSYDIQVLPMETLQKNVEDGVLLGSHHSQMVVRCVSRIDHSFLWKWVKFRVTIDKSFPFYLPYHSVWWDERLLLPFADGYFILMRNPHQDQSFDVYTRLASDQLPTNVNSVFVDLIVSILKNRLPGIQVRYVDFSELNFEVIHQNPQLNFKKQSRMIEINPYQANSWFLADLFSLEYEVYEWLMSWLDSNKKNHLASAIQ